MINYEERNQDKLTRTIYEEKYKDKLILWYSPKAYGVSDDTNYARLLWKWLVFFVNVGRTLWIALQNVSPPVLMRALEQFVVWLLFPIVALFILPINIIDYLYSDWLTRVFGGSSLVNRGSIPHLRLYDGDKENRDFRKLDFDLYNARLLCHLCSLSYEDPRSKGFKQLLRQWNISTNFRTAASESAIAHIWTLMEKKGKEEIAFCIVTFKGTSPLDLNEWLSDAEISQIQADCIFENEINNEFVHSGFYNALWSGGSRHWDNIIEQVNATCRSIPDAKKINLWFTGHSLGAGTASLAYAKMLFSGSAQIEDKRVQFCGAYTFGTPRIGNKKFCDTVQKRSETNAKLYRVVNANDIITMIPIAVFPHSSREYCYLGKAFYLSLYGSPKPERGTFDSVKNFLLSYKELFNDLLTLLSPSHQPEGVRYNCLVRWLTPIMLYDHFPTQYIKHINP